MDMGVLGGGGCVLLGLCCLLSPSGGSRAQGSVQWCGVAPMSQLRGE